MPTYVLKCSQCNSYKSVNRTEYMIYDYDKVCPVCKMATMSQVLYPPAVVYKTKGFYKTDYER